MVIWPEFRTRQYRVNDHPYHAPQFILAENERKYDHLCKQPRLDDAHVLRRTLKDFDIVYDYILGIHSL